MTQRLIETSEGWFILPSILISILLLILGMCGFNFPKSLIVLFILIIWVGTRLLRIFNQHRKIKQRCNEMYHFRYNYIIKLYLLTVLIFKFKIILVYDAQKLLGLSYIYIENKGSQLFTPYSTWLYDDKFSAKFFFYFRIFNYSHNISFL